jgi:hypothetical protein
MHTAVNIAEKCLEHQVLRLVGMVALVGFAAVIEFIFDLWMQRRIVKVFGKLFPKSKFALAHGGA